MIIFLGTAFLFLIVGFMRAGEKFDYMSIESTNAVKGFFLIMVFLSHIQGYGITFIV